MKLSSLTPVAAVLAVSLSAVAHAETSNPFMAKPLSTIVVAANDHEGKCGAMNKEEGAKEGKCGGKMRAGEGKMMDADTNKDGKISKAEFMAKHEAMFTAADTNKDGIADSWAAQNLPSGKTYKDIDKKSGYSYLELYINSLVAHIMKQGCEGSTASPCADDF